MVKIVHARISESGQIEGVPGDQTGREVVETENVVSGWQWVIRACSAGKRETIARAASAAAANDRIGYGQKDRLTLWECWKKYAQDIAAIKKKCNCDCSSLVAVCCLQAGITVSPDIWTGNEKAALVGTGEMVSFPYGQKELMTGDILLKSGHTAIVVKGEPGAENDHVLIAAEVPAYSFDGILYGTYMCMEDAAYIRNGGGLSYPAIGYILYGHRVYNYGYYTQDERGVKWLLCETAYINGIKYIGFISERTLQHVDTKKSTLS